MKSPHFPGSQLSLVHAPTPPDPPDAEKAKADSHLVMVKLSRQLDGVHPMVGTTALCTLMCACARQAGVSLEDLQQMVAATHRKTE
jgi:hypothetical protein